MTVVTDPYRKLQQHLDTMPVGYPPTESGVEIALLEAVFTPEQAEVATHLDYRHKTIDQIFDTAEEVVGSKEGLERLLDESVASGGITRRYRDGGPQYALLPLVLWGMFEHRLTMLDPDYLENFGRYMQGEFTSQVPPPTPPRTRYIPVEESIHAELRIATYDELHHIIEQAEERLCIQECICKKINDARGKPCQTTDRREVCMSFGDLADLYVEQGWGRRITRDEALEIARKNQEQGLVLMPGNAQEPTFMCACCEDCCALLGMYKYLPAPVGMILSNFEISIDPELCSAHGQCIDICPMDAISLDGGPSTVDLARCIGCGLCVPECPENAIRLATKPAEAVPPRTDEDLYDEILARKEAFLHRA